MKNLLIFKGYRRESRETLVGSFNSMIDDGTTSIIVQYRPDVYTTGVSCRRFLKKMLTTIFPVP